MENDKETIQLKIEKFHYVPILKISVIRNFLNTGPCHQERRGLRVREKRFC